MASTFYGNRRIFETNIKTLNASPCKNFPNEKQHARSSILRSFSLQDKSRKITNLNKATKLSKKQSRSCKVTSEKWDSNSGMESTTENTVQKSPRFGHSLGSVARQKSIDESAIVEVDNKIYVHGYCGVGKSMLIHQLANVLSTHNGIFDVSKENRDEMFINSSVHTYHIKEIDVLFKGSFKDADIHLVVFAMDDIISMKYAVDRVTFLRWKCRIQSPIFIIGNKRDEVVRIPNFVRDVEFITEKLSCRYLPLSGYNMACLKAALNTVIMPQNDACCTPNKNNIFKNIFKCFFSMKKR